MKAVILPLMEQKAAAIETLTLKQENLLTPMTNKAQASKDLAEEMMAQLSNHILLAGVTL